MHVARLLPLELDLVPLVNATVCRQSSQLDCGFSNEIRAGHVFVPDCHVHVIANVFDVNVEAFVLPAGRLARIVLGFGAQTLHARFNGHVRVHLAESFGVASKARLQNLYCQNSGCRHSFFLFSCFAFYFQFWLLIRKGVCAERFCFGFA